jgi:glutaminyl-peptide cyclotransferase
VRLFPLILFLTGFAQAAICPRSPTISLTTQDIIRTLSKPKSYLEGLVFYEGRLYESNGLYGHSSLSMTDANTGAFSTLSTGGSNFFFEGLAVIDQKIFQLTYQEQKILEYDLLSGSKTVSPPRFRDLPGESWGLARLGSSLVLSDGTSTLRILDPKTLRTQRRLSVHDRNGERGNLNALAEVGRNIFANIFGSPLIAVIDPASGCVTTELDLSQIINNRPDLLDAGGALCSSQCNTWDFVANGIAYNATTNELFVTGKNWPVIFVFNNPLE